MRDTTLLDELCFQIHLDHTSFCFVTDRAAQTAAWVEFLGRKLPSPTDSVTTSRLRNICAEFPLSEFGLRSIPAATGHGSLPDVTRSSRVGKAHKFLPSLRSTVGRFVATQGPISHRKDERIPAAAGRLEVLGDCKKKGEDDNDCFP